MTAIATARQNVVYLIAPETAVETSGEGAAFDLGGNSGKPALVILKVTDIIEQESLLVSVWGSADGKDWGTKSLFQYPERFYRGVTPASIDLAQRPEIKFLQARWHVNRWGRGYPRPHFKISLEIQTLTGS